MVNPSKRPFCKNAPTIIYVDIPSSITPVSHNSQIIVPILSVHHESGQSTNSRSAKVREEEECDVISEVENKSLTFLINMILTI